MDIQEQQRPPNVYTDDSKDFKRVILSWTLPIVIISFLLAGIASQGLGGAGPLFAAIVWYPVVFIFTIATIVLGIIYMRRGQKRKAAGVFYSLAIGLISMGFSWFAIVSNW
jgi:uncharacterized membrane protein SirB2